MSHSTHKLEYVLVYNNHLDKARWLTKSNATLAMRALGERLELILPSDENYEALAKLAGKQPEHYIQASENYNAPEGEGPAADEPKPALPESGPPGS